MKPQYLLNVFYLFKLCISVTSLHCSEQAELHDQRKEWRRQKRSGVENVKLYAMRFLINLLVLALLGGALYLITFTAEQMIEVNFQSVTVNS